MTDRPGDKIHPDLQLALDRMIEVGWVEEYTFDASGLLTVKYTDPGIAQLGGFWHFLHVISGHKGIESLNQSLWRGIVQTALLKFGKIPPGQGG